MNWAQASQTTTVRMCRKVVTVISCWSHSRLGTPLGNGHPMDTASAPGTPTTRPSSATNAKNALTKSPKERRRIVTGWGVRFLGAVELPVERPVELEVLRRGMAGVLGCVGWGGGGARGPGVREMY